MECISVCPDTALPNTSQDLSTLLRTAVSYYVARDEDRAKLLHALPEIEKQARQRMLAEIKTGTPLPTILREVTDSLVSKEQGGFSQQSKQQFFDILAKVPMAYQKAVSYTHLDVYKRQQ